MKKEIKFIASVADGKLNPNLGFIRLIDGVIQGGNQHLFVQMDCETGLDITIDATRALSAVNAIKGDIAIKETARGVSISGGGVRVSVPTIESDQYPAVEPSGDKISLSGNIINQLSIAKLFAADGDVRPYLNGVALNNGRIKASNGHAAISMTGADGIDAILPTRAIDFLVKIGDEPDSVSQGHGSVTFYYNWGWVRCVSIDGKFPNIDMMFETDAEFTETGALSDAVASCKSVVGNSGKLNICDKSISGDESVEVEIETGLNPATYNCGLLATMLSVADAISIQNDDKPKAVFRGEYDFNGVVSPIIR